MDLDSIYNLGLTCRLEYHIKLYLEVFAACPNFVTECSELHWIHMDGGTSDLRLSQLHGKKSTVFEMCPHRKRLGYDD